jgi:hypothetical protein
MAVVASAQADCLSSFELESPLVKVGSVRPMIAGPTLILSFDMPEASQIEIDLHILDNGVQDYELKTNSAPYKGVKLETPPVVGDSWDGTRWPERSSHVTIVPFNEFQLLSDEQKEKLQTLSISVAVSKNDVFWTRGSPGNAAAGCKGVFYANMVLSPETEQQIEKAREIVGLPPRPPSAAHFSHENDTDECLKEFRFHKSFTSVVPRFVDETDHFASMDKDSAQSGMIAMAEQISKWSSGFRILRKRGKPGNILVRGARC